MLLLMYIIHLQKCIENLMTIVYHREIVKQKQLICDTLTYHCLLFLNVNLVITFLTYLNMGDLKLFLVSGKFKFLLAKANYQFSSYALASSSHVYVGAFELMNCFFCFFFSLNSLQSCAGYRGSSEERSRTGFEMDISTQPYWMRAHFSQIVLYLKCKGVYVEKNWDTVAKRASLQCMAFFHRIWPLSLMYFLPPYLATSELYCFLLFCPSINTANSIS